MLKPSDNLKNQVLVAKLKSHFDISITTLIEENEEVTLEIDADHLIEVCSVLRSHADFRFEMLMDLSGVDYSAYGISEWMTNKATETAFSRGVEVQENATPVWTKPRFAAVYHLLSLHYNVRLRCRCFADPEHCRLPSIVNIWNSANWYEREAFDLFGIVFEGHPDLRRILTDYGFIGHPFRKDFPLIGNLEMRYSAKDQRVVYEAVSIKPRTLVPKVIRDDHRYIETP